MSQRDISMEERKLLKMLEAMSCEIYKPRLISYADPMNPQEIPETPAFTHPIQKARGRECILKLHEQEEYVRNVIEHSSSDVVLVMNTDGLITFASPSIERVLGHSTEEVIGKPFFHYVEESEKPAAILKLVSAIKTGKPSVLSKIIMKRKDGRPAYVEGSISLLKPSEQIIGVIWVFRDISLRIFYMTRIEVLHSHSERLTLATSLSDVVKITLDAIERVIGYTIMAFGVVSGNLLRFPYVKGPISIKAPEMRLSGPGIAVRAVVTGQTQIINSTDLDPDYVDCPGGESMFSELVVPVVVDGVVVGVINLEHTEPYSFSCDDRKFLELMAMRVASEWTRIGQMKMLEAQSLHLLGMSTLGMASNIGRSTKDGITYQSFKFS